MKSILIHILGYIFPYYHLFEKKENLISEDLDVPNGDKVRLIKDYPLKNIGLRVNRTYDVIEYYKFDKRISNNKSIPINCMRIINEDGESITVSNIFFENI